MPKKPYQWFTLLICVAHSAYFSKAAQNSAAASNSRSSASRTGRGRCGASGAWALAIIASTSAIALALRSRRDALPSRTFLREDGPAAPSMLGRCFLDFLRVRNRLVAGLPFPPFLTRIGLDWIVTKPLPPHPLFRGPQPRKTFRIYPRSRRVEVSTTGRGRRLKSGEIPAHGRQFPVRRSKFPARL